MAVINDSYNFEYSINRSFDIEKSLLVILIIKYGSYFGTTVYIEVQVRRDELTFSFDIPCSKFFSLHFHLSNFIHSFFNEFVTVFVDSLRQMHF